MPFTLCCFDTVSTSEVGVIERFGKYSRLAEVYFYDSSYSDLKN
jgi:hypothetical protein